MYSREPCRLVKEWAGGKSASPRTIYIMRNITREDITNLPIKPRIKRDLRFVPEEISDWVDRDFIAVMNRAQSEGVLIAELGERYVATFRLQKRSANSQGRVEAIICDFCATWQRGSNSFVISFQKEKGSVSFLCCGDLLCSFHVREKTLESKLSRTQLRETVSVEGKIQRLRNRLKNILQEVKET